MLFRKLNVLVLATICALSICSVAIAHETQTTPAPQQKVTINKYDVADPTDALAVPSDTSAAEQEAEMTEMKNLETKPAKPVAPVTK